MPHLTLELLLLMLLVFLIGCILGCLFRTMFAAGTAPVAKPGEAGTRDAKAASAAVPQSAPKAKPVPVETPEAASAPKPAAAKPAIKPVARPAVKPATGAVAAPKSSGKPARPKGLPGARNGKPDNLQMISGVGPKLEKILHGLGFFHFDQIADWSSDQVEWVDEHLRYKGRIERDAWIAQARLLAAGDMDQFSALFGPGGSGKAASKGKSGGGRPAGKKK